MDPPSWSSTFTAVTREENRSLHVGANEDETVACLRLGPRLALDRSSTELRRVWAWYLDFFPKTTDVASDSVPVIPGTPLSPSGQRVERQLEIPLPVICSSSGNGSATADIAERTVGMVVPHGGEEPGMTITVDGIDDLADWALSKACGPWRAGDNCIDKDTGAELPGGHPGCVQAQRAADLLRAMRRHEGEPAVGWLIADDEVDDSLW